MHITLDIPAWLGLCVAAALLCFPILGYNVLLNGAFRRDTKAPFTYFQLIGYGTMTFFTGAIFRVGGFPVFGTIAATNGLALAVFAGLALFFWRRAGRPSIRIYGALTGGNKTSAQATKS